MFPVQCDGSIILVFRSRFLCQDAKLLPEKLRSQMGKNSFELVIFLTNLNEMYCNIIRGWN